MNKESVFESLKHKLLKSIKETLTLEAEAPKEEKPVDFDVRVPIHQLKLVDDCSDTAEALVIYAVRCPTEKTHAVRIKFNFDKSGSFLRNTMSYV